MATTRQRLIRRGAGGLSMSEPAPSNREQAPRRPNLLFIYTDEQAARTMAAYGNDVIETPNLNRFAQDAIVFENAYVTQPVCTPSRSSLLTGLYPHANGCTENNIPLDEEVPCLPEIGDFSDYRTAHFGKWHLGDEVFAQHGFDEWRSTEDAYRRFYRPGRDRNQHCDYYHWLINHGMKPPDSGQGFSYFMRSFAARLPEELGKPAFLAEEASRFIRENRARPFILYVNFLEPHMPFFGPRDDQHDPEALPLPANFDAHPGPDQPLKLRLFREQYRHRGAGTGPLGPETNWRRLIANYWGLCSLVDTHFGKIVDTLSECGLDDNTIVVYTSDHGDMMGSHGLVGKCTQYEEASRVPLMLRAPWLDRPCRRISSPVSHIDLVPTLLELMGQLSPSHLQGQSWVADLQEQGGFPGRDVLVEWNGPNSGAHLKDDDGEMYHYMARLASEQEANAAFADPVRTIVSASGWKFNCNPRRQHELYNLREDPAETTNRMGDPAVRDLVHDLYDRILEWQKRVGDTVDLSGCSLP